MLLLIVAAAVGVFLYGRILDAQKASKDAALTKAEAGIDNKAAENFVRLRDRLAAGKGLIAGHVALSPFFDDLSTLIPTGVRLASLDITPVAGAPAKLAATGSARTFNQLAVLSSNLAADGRIKDAIFSNLTVSSVDGSVAFTLAATVDPALTTFTADLAAKAALSGVGASGSAASSMAATTTTQTP